MDQAYACNIPSKLKVINNLIRFVPSVICCVVLTISKLVVLWFHILMSEEIFSLSYGVYWFIITKLYKETHNVSQSKYFLINIVGYGLIILYVSYIGNSIHVIKPSLYSIGLFFFTLIVPFIGKNNNYIMINFILNMFKNLIFSINITAIVVVILFIILFGLDSLFAMEPSIIASDSVMILAIYLLYPLILISGIPCEYQSSRADLAERLTFICKYLLIPVVFTSGVILNANAIKCYIYGDSTDLFREGYSLLNINVIILIFTFILFALYILTADMNLKALSILHRYFPTLVIIPLSLSCTVIWYAFKKDIIQMDLLYYHELIFNILGIVSALYSAVSYKKSVVFMIASLSITIILTPLGYQLLFLFQV